MDAAFLLSILIVMVLIGISIFVGVKLVPKNVPDSTRQQGYKNFFIALALGVGIVAALWAVLFLGFRQSAKNSLFLSWAIIIVVSYALVVYYWLQNKKKAGRLLLDLVPYPNKKLGLISGFLFIGLGFAGTYTDWFGDLPYARLFSGLIGLLVGAHRILVSFSHIRVHENGVLAYLDLVKWEKIESFQWISGNERADTLQLKYKGRLPAFMRRGAIPVPIEKKTDLELILEQYLSVSLPAPQPAA